MQLATLIDLHYTVGTFSRRNTENIEIQTAAQPQIEGPPPYKKKQTLDLSMQELEIAESSVTTVIDIPEPTKSPPELSYSLQSVEPIAEIATDGIRDPLNDHYLPEQLSSLTLDNDHGVSLNCFLHIIASHVFFPVPTIPSIRDYPTRSIVPQGGLVGWRNGGTSTGPPCPHQEI